ncbi:hypothetical protein CI102_8523 [Trichoderma harzianum]|nr:hypothetical protein CI102_8523 [Trichoderma harzianum]
MTLLVTIWEMVAFTFYIAWKIEGYIIYFIYFDICRSSPTWCACWVIACIAHHLVELVYARVRDVKLPIPCVCATKAHVACLP